MAVDNELYDRLSDTWWDEDSNMAILRTAVNPGRLRYIRRILLEELKLEPQAGRALDVGCGGGLLAEEVARLGFRVTGVDPSEPSLETARAHADEESLDIEYLAAVGEDLPFDDATFDVVYCCDVLEHVDSVDRTVAEAARVLKPGGAYLYDTINRTLRSRLVTIGLIQEWGPTRFMEPNVHDWRMFIKPAELEATLRRHGLELRDSVGLAPAANPLRLLRDLRRRRKGEITYAELGRRMEMRESRDRSNSYMGYALKPR